jgi:tRNA G18 (ribose-2'-O)-methylase SpoU
MFGIGIYHTKTETNVGSLFRSAVCFGANYVFTIGRRYSPQASDTPKSWKHIPLFHYSNKDEFLRNRPFDAELIGVEIVNGARDLANYCHPRNAIYLLGPEDGSIQRELLAQCNDIVKFDSKYCLNVACAGSVIMYDRQSKGFYR